jgi:hypothetical protein
MKKTKEHIEIQNQEQELVERLRFWKTVSIEKRLEWLENSMHFVREIRRRSPK